jgi:hypothetical protein
LRLPVAGHPGPRQQGGNTDDRNEQQVDRAGGAPRGNGGAAGGPALAGLLAGRSPGFGVLAARLRGGSPSGDAGLEAGFLAFAVDLCPDEPLIDAAITSSPIAVRRAGSPRLPADDEQQVRAAV